MYAQLCKRLAEQAPNFEPTDTKITTFKRLLLRQCRDEFENRAAVSATFEKRVGDLTVDEEEARFIAKRKMLGNIKFIGELGKLEMLHDSILHRCCEQLLVGRRKQPIHDQIEDLECLAHLIKTCGRVLDTAKAKPLVDQYFDRLRAIIANNDTPTRIKFLLQDVIEMRENRWLPRKLVTPDGPRTIQQVREDAARDGCIYLPQQDNIIKTVATPSHLQEVLFSKSRPKGMEDIFGGPGPQGPAGLGIGPGVIGGDNDSFVANYNNNNSGYRNGGGGGGGGGGNSAGGSNGGGPSFEEKFNANNHHHHNNSSGNGYGRDSDGRDHHHHHHNHHHRNNDYNSKPKRDSFESRFTERPDFGDRFTANRNKTHPSNRGGGGLGGRAGDMGSGGGGNNRDNNGRSNGGGGGGGRSSDGGLMMMSRGGNNMGGAYDNSKNNGVSPQHLASSSINSNNSSNSSSDKDMLPPRFKKMGLMMSSGGSGGSGGGNGGGGGGGGNSANDAPSLRPSSTMMLKPKTPSSLPKSAMAKLEGISPSPNSLPKVMMTTGEPAVFISRQSGEKKRNEKKNQGPTRDEVFGRIDDILGKLFSEEEEVGGCGSTNEATTAWKESEIPAKMVNNALIHLFKQIVKLPAAGQRALALDFVEQLCTEESVTQVHCKEGLARLVALAAATLETAEGGLAELAVWSVTHDKTGLADFAEMTEGGASHPLFFAVLQQLGEKDAAGLTAAFKENTTNTTTSIKLLDQLPTELRTEEELGRVLAERQLTFLQPLLHIRAEIWRQLEPLLLQQDTTASNNNNFSAAEFLAWLTANVPAEHHADPAFISALVDNILRYVTERCNSSSINGGSSSAEETAVLVDREKELIMSFKPVLMAFLKQSALLQLTTVYRLQVHCHGKEFPKGLLLRWFVAFYDGDIIEEGVFLKWKEDVNDSFPGKGKALFQVNQWLTWLEEAESEDEEEDE